VRSGIGVAAVLGLLACGAEDEPEATPCQTDEECADGFVCEGGVCVGQASSGATEEGSAEDGSSSSGGDESMGSSGSTSGPPPTTMPPMSTGDDADACEPDDAPFILGDDMILRSSIGFDPGGPSCAASSSDSDEPQILFEVRMTGKIDATGYGVEIEESTHGQVFTDPPVGDSQNIDLPIELNITITATIGGTPAMIHFRFSELGPALQDVSVEWG
jgi:hypothetical protein